nr:uncharacterized protein LOC109175044 [Ipomoea batatas]
MISSPKPLFSLLVFALLIVSQANSAPIAIDEDDSGVCPMLDPSTSCPITCFRPDSVCGVDGVTYWCDWGFVMWGMVDRVKLC